MHTTAYLYPSVPIMLSTTTAGRHARRRGNIVDVASSTKLLLLAVAAAMIASQSPTTATRTRVAASAFVLVAPPPSTGRTGRRSRDCGGGICFGDDAHRVNDSPVPPLFGRKRGSLRKNFDEGDLDFAPASAAAPKKPSKKKKSAPRQKKGSAGRGAGEEAAGISPALAQWASTQKQAPPSSSTSPSTHSSSPPKVSSTSTADATATYASFEAFEEDETPTPSPPSSSKKNGRGSRGGGGKTVSRRERQVERKSSEAAASARARSVVSNLEDLVNAEKGRDLTAILSGVRDLVDCSTPGMRVLSAGSRDRDYRMGWAGSDDAVCHLGTGLHKVPLARLEEVFMTIGKNRIRVQEVIRILGPFPNVKNMLLGDTSISKVKSRGSDKKFRIAYDSMIDGTGKEILAGKDENVRVVDLDVLYAGEEAIVCGVPREAGGGNEEEDEGSDDAFANDGRSLLVFFREMDLDARLESMRVA